MGKEKRREGLIYVLVYKPTKTALAMYFRKENYWCGFSLEQAEKWNTREEAEQQLKQIKKETGLDFEIEEHKL